MPTRRLLLIGPDDPTLVTDLTAQTGATVELLPRQDSEGLAWVLDDVTNAVTQAPDTDLVLLADLEGLRVIRLGTNRTGPPQLHPIAAIGERG